MRALLPAVVLLLPALPLPAQEAPAPPPPKASQAEDVWVLQMDNPPREYAVRISRLEAVTLQDYDVRREGKVQRVVELTVETGGGNRARFFWEDEAEPVIKLPDELERKKAEVEKAVKEATGIERRDDKPARVMKDYPVTTHSGWAEFKMCAEADVRSLHRQLLELWTGRKRQE